MPSPVPTPGPDLPVADRSPARDSATRSAQCYFARKIKETRGIEQIDLAAVPLYRRYSRGNGKLALDLFGIKVTNRVAVRDLANAVGYTGDIEQALDQRGLAVAAVTHQTYITDLVNRIIRHSLISHSPALTCHRALPARYTPGRFVSREQSSLCGIVPLVRYYTPYKPGMQAVFCAYFHVAFFTTPSNNSGGHLVYVSHTF